MPLISWVRWVLATPYSPLTHFLFPRFVSERSETPILCGGADFFVPLLLITLTRFFDVLYNYQVRGGNPPRTNLVPISLVSSTCTGL